MIRTVVWCAVAIGAATAGAQETAPPVQTPAVDAGRAIVERLEQEAAAVRPLVKHPLTEQFLSATRHLPTVKTRTVWRNREKGTALSAAQYEALPEAERDGYAARECPPAFYYLTGYGTPLVYARPLDLAFAALPEAHATVTAREFKVLDFGYGTIGHLRLLASFGVHGHGVDVEPMFEALYSEPGDTGEVFSLVNLYPSGSITLHTGQFPADDDLAATIGAAGPYDLFISKNTLKRGYVHPERECDPKLLVHLGVDDETFVRTMHEVLKPGGVAMIYNISPAPAAEDQPYIPWADGRCPFDRAMLEAAGFEVVAFDEDDAEALHALWMALGLNGKQSAEELKSSIFAKYTLLRRKG